ncbi:MAG: hypothetical protein KF898_03680 [Parachlamydiales bacterium]|nr:hypothetical protein [Verrucomicrobiota bacterium]MBX3718732.1 hypothetical protein [Candidatus Acheromyda pituitae]
MSLDLIGHNIPILRQAAEQFREGDVAGGKSSFAMVHHDVKEGIYYTMWQSSGSPNIPKFGTNRFNDSNGLTSTSIEKAQVIYQYFRSKGITTIPSDHSLVREAANSHRHPVDMVSRFGKASVRLQKEIQQCDETERCTVLTILGGATLVVGAAFGIAHQIASLVNR